MNTTTNGNTAPSRFEEFKGLTVDHIYESQALGHRLEIRFTNGRYIEVLPVTRVAQHLGVLTDLEINAFGFWRSG